MQTVQNNNLIMKEVMIQWIENKQYSIKKSTYVAYKRMIEKTLIPICGNLSIGTIDCKTIKNVIEQLLQKYSAKTARDIFGVFNQIVQYADDNEYLNHKILTNIKIPYQRKTPIVLTRLEQTILTSYLMKNTDLLKLGVLLCLYTGIRLGELCGLQWGDIDLRRNLIHIRRSVQRLSDGNGQTSFLIDSPKTNNSEREIPIPSFLIAYIKNNKAKNDSAYLTSGNDQFTQPRTYQNRLKAYLKACDLPLYHFHTLRHTFATRAIELGFDAKSLSEILGHANVKITLDLYVHPSIELKQQQMDLFSSLVP